jgi:hypothetical protein
MARAIAWAPAVAAGVFAGAGAGIAADVHKVTAGSPHRSDAVATASFFNYADWHKSILWPLR